MAEDRLDVAAHASLSSSGRSSNHQKVVAAQQLSLLRRLGLSSLIDRPGPVFEATEIEDIVVTHIFEQLASEGRSPA